MQRINIQHNKYLITAIEAALILVSINIYLINRYSFFNRLDNDVMLSMAYAGIIIWILWVEKERPANVIRSRFFYCAAVIGSFVFSIIQFAGKSYTVLLAFNPQRYIETIPACIRTIAAIAGGTLLYWFIILTVMRVFDHTRDTGEAHSSKPSWISNIVDGDYLFIKCVLFISLFWIPQILIHYPGVMQQDGWLILGHYWQDSEIWTESNPAIFSILLDKLSAFGLSSGHAAWGIFVLTLIQSAASILSMSYTITVMRRFGISVYWRMVALIFYAVLPVFSASSTTIIADAIYLPAFLLMITELLIAVRSTDSFLKQPYHILLTIISAIGMSFSYSGIFIMLLTAAGLIVWMIISMIRRCEDRRNIIIITCVFAASLIMMYFLTIYLDNNYSLGRVLGRSKKALAVQQLGRCARQHPESFDQGDEKVLNKVIGLDIDKIAEHYDPYNYGALKQYCEDDVSAEQMKDFYCLWYKMIKRHPRTCLDSIVQQSVCAFSVLAKDEFYYDDSECMIHRDYYYDYADIYQYKGKSLHGVLKERLVKCYYDFRFYPFLGIFTYLALYTILLFVLFVISIDEGDWKKLIVLLPLAGILIIVAFGPACFNYLRFAYPVIYAMPIVFAESAVFGKEIHS